ncbi:MAG: Nucleosomal histone H3-Lys79 methylase [Chaenotheca gracillima]|nr:MAG: Nucleosomal histone H3-Lys79 methylase [Chaenotheca gracillima]
MGFFDQLQTNGSTAIRPQNVKVIRKVVSKPPTESRPSNTATSSASPRRVNSAQPISRANKAQTNGKHGSTQSSRALQPPSPSKVRKRRSPVTQQRLVSSDSDSEDDADLSLAVTRKKARTGGPGDEPDLERQICSERAFSPSGDQELKYVHAADIASLEKSNKFTPAFEASVHELDLELQYPSTSPRERYQLVQPRDKEDYTPVHDILQVVELTAKSHLPADQSGAFLDEEHGILRRLKRAIARKSVDEFRAGVVEFNEAVARLTTEGVIKKHLESLHAVNHTLMEHILTQTYARTVSLKVDTLRKYENGTDNVYGELLPRFISKIFYETGLKSKHVIVDLGSGVANVVLQAALEVGCESWGCEMMDNACELAELQRQELIARCRLWGIEPGGIHLERGNFLKNTAIGRVLQRADVVLVNNQAFTPELNNGLVNLFLDLKEGCQIVSLKSFVPQGHKITTRNFNSPVNLLTVEEKTYYSDCVSWTNAPGTYCIAKKDSRKLKAFEKRFM